MEGVLLQDFQSKPASVCKRRKPKPLALAVNGYTARRTVRALWWIMVAKRNAVIAGVDDTENVGDSATVFVLGEDRIPGDVRTNCRGAVHRRGSMCIASIRTLGSPSRGCLKVGSSISPWLRCLRGVCVVTGCMCFWLCFLSHADTM